MQLACMKAVELAARRGESLPVDERKEFTLTDWGDVGGFKCRSPLQPAREFGAEPALLVPWADRLNSMMTDHLATH